MRTTLDRQTDELRIQFTDALVCRSEEVRPYLVLDQEGRIVAVTIRGASDWIAAGPDVWDEKRST
jgi:hypothetical protein